MSCVIHDDKTYNQIFWTIEAGQEHNGMLRECFRHIADVPGLIKRLHSWNHIAYATRYNEEADIPEFTPRAESPKLTPVELVKRLQSINYQCSDSNEYEQCNDKTTVKNTITKLCAHIVSELAEYEKAAWI